jgi:hypothetical protein
LGIEAGAAEEDRVLVRAMVAALSTRTVGIDRFFFDWRGGRVPDSEAYAAAEFRALADLLRGREQPAEHAYWSDPAPCSMHIEEVEAIWAPIARSDDWTMFEQKIAAIRRMGEAHGRA